MRPISPRTFPCLVLLALLFSLGLPPAPAAAEPPALFDLTLQLDGVDDYATAPDNGYWLDVGSLYSSSAATWETFFYVADLNNDSPDFLLYKPQAYQLYINYSSTGPDAVVLGLGTGTVIFLSHQTNLAVGWHHLAATFQRQSGPDLRALYLDGSLVAFANDVDFITGLPDSDQPLYVGSAVGTGFASGWLEETRISGVARYSGSSYTVPTQRFTPDSDTHALWHFDEVWGSAIFADSSTHANTLTGSNGAQVGNPLGAAADPLQAGPVYTVNSTAESDDGYCTALDCTLLEALNTANRSPANDTIQLQPNLTYTFNQYHHKGTSQTALPPISGSLTIHGHGAVIQRAPSLPCTIDRDNPVVEPGEFRLFYVNTGSSLSLDQLTLSNGCSDSDPGAGGAIYNGGTLSLDQATFSNNRTFWSGGAVHTAANASLLANNATFTGNQAEMGGALFFYMNSSGLVNGAVFTGNSATDGGAIENWGNLTAGDVTLTGNTANASLGGDGGAIKNANNGSLALSDCLIEGNSADEGGGVGSYGASSVLTVTRCVFHQNTADDDGGAIFSANDLTLTQSAIRENSAGRIGGGIYASDGTISGSEISGNQALHGGGLMGFALTIEHSTLSGNSALANGGGIYIYSGDIYLNHVTITDNTADSDSYHPTPLEDTGGGVYGRGTVARIHPKNSIIAGNHDNSGVAPEIACEIISQDYNLIGTPGGLFILNPVGPHDLLDVDARLAPLANNGGPTQTHALRIFSPAVDRIPPGANGCGSQFTLDQRGLSRPADGDGDGASGCDAGAFEAAVDSLAPLRNFLPLLRR